MTLTNPNLKKSIVLLFVFTLISSFLFAQQSREKKELVEILKSIEETYHYKFTYANDVVEGIVLEEPQKELTLNEILSYLENKTSLVFKVLNDQFIAINPKDVSFFICGYVIDNEFKDPIPDVTVEAANNQTVTDLFGYFKLEVSSVKELITFRHLGFTAFSKPVYEFEEGLCSNVFLNPQVESLSEVVLNSYISKGINKVIDGSFNIDFSNFGIVPGLIETDVLQTVQALPGIQSIDETVSNINIRGGTNDQNLVLWDGMKMYQSGHFFGLISMFNPLITNDITLIKNGTSADLSDGVSGTIDMHTDSKINKELKSSVGLNFINADLFFDVPLGERSSIQVSGRKAINDIQQTPTYKEYYDRILQDSELTDPSNTDSNVLFDFYDTSARWIYTPSERDLLQLNFIMVLNNLDASLDQISSSLDQCSLALGGKYKRTWNEKFSTQLQVYQSTYYIDARTDDELKPQLYEQENSIIENSIKLNSWLKINDNLTLLNGYQFTETGVTVITDKNNPILYNKNKDVIWENALYSQATISFPEIETNVRAGFRYNYLTVLYGDGTEKQFSKHLLEPRLSVNHKLSQHFSLELLGELKHQNTMQVIQNDELTSPTEYLNIEKRKWVTSNGQQFDIITSKQASFGLNYSQKGWLTSLEGFYKQVDGINTLSQGFLNQYEFLSANGAYKVYGGELLINKKIKKISAWLSYTYGKNDYTFDNEIIVEKEFPNNFDITHTLTFGASYISKNLKSSVGFNYHTGAPTTLPVTGDPIEGNEINFMAANSNRLTDYIRLDASVMYNFNIAKNIKASTGISIWNFLNQTNSISRYFRVEDNEVLENKKVALKFTPNAVFRVSF